MTGQLLWTLIFVQMAMGVADTLIHHEGTERLAWRPSQARELRLHGVRNLFYAGIFLVLGWTHPAGAVAGLLLIVLVAEIFITLWDFVEEDRSRKLPPSERVLHTLMALNYGAILALLIPVLLEYAREPTSLTAAYYGLASWACAVAVFGVTLFGLRDLAAAARARRLVEAPAARLAWGLPARSRILVTGATGFVGSRLVESLVAAGHEVTALTRTARKAFVLPAPIRIITEIDQVGNDAGFDAIVHLAGEPLADGLWTEKKKARVIESRVAMTAALVALMARLETKPRAFIAASAVGWYGMRGPESLDETDPGAPSFSHESCAAVEAAARAAELHGARVVRLRIGLVLAPSGGLLARMLTPFEFGLGGPFGDGAQMMSWITRDDLVRLIVYAIRCEALAGAVNAAAPNAVSNAAFSKALARALGRPAIFSVPAAPLRLALGQFADELLLGGQNAKPAKAEAAGFVFAEQTIEQAFAVILGARQHSPEAAAPGAVATS